MFRFFCFFTCLLTGAPAISLADAAVLESRVIDFQINKEGFRLEVVNGYLPTVLKEISGKTGLVFHYSVLPESQVFATCLSQSLQDILKCLFGESIDMVFRFADNSSSLNKGRKIQEVWLLGSTLSRLEKNAEQCPQVEHRSLLLSENTKHSLDQKIEPSMAEKLAFRKKMAVSDDPQSRVQAMSFLALHAPPKDNEFRLILDDALLDDNAEVRGQAIASLILWQGELESVSEIRQALLDDEVSVRISVLQQIKEMTALFQQSLGDKSEIVREFAAMKIQAEKGVD